MNIKRIGKVGDFHVLMLLCVSEVSILHIFPFNQDKICFFPQNWDYMLSALSPGAT